MQQNKCADISKAIAQIHDGASVMIGGFGIPGTPFVLIEALVKHGVRNLTIIKNDANEMDMGVDWLLASGQVSKLVTSHTGLNSRAGQLMRDGALEIEYVPQGILAERIRIAGAGLMGFVSDIGMETRLSEGKQILHINDKPALFEPALSADFALIHADKADEMGNLRYAKSARNFNPLMAMAAHHVIVEAECILEIGAIDADDVHTPAPFVDQIVPLGALPKVYDVVER